MDLHTYLKKINILGVIAHRVYDIQYFCTQNPFGLLYRLDNCFSVFFIHRTLHPGKIGELKIGELKIGELIIGELKIGELLKLENLFLCHIHVPLLVNTDKTFIYTIL